MKLLFPSHSFASLGAAALLLSPGSSSTARAQQASESPFLSTTIDLGCVVSDIEESVKFYKEAIGFQEGQGFGVPADFAERVGLTAGKKLDIRVLVLGEGDGVTKLKLMQLPGCRLEEERQHAYSFATGIQLPDDRGEEHG